MSLGKTVYRQLSPITDQIFLTGMAGVKDTAMLLDAKITHVLNLAEELAGLEYPADLQVRFQHWRDSKNQKLIPHLDALVDHVHEVVQDGGRIVVHCVAGMSRSASVCIAYLVKSHGMTLRDAHDKVKAARDVIYLNIGFWHELIEYEFQLRGENSVEILNYLAGEVPSVECYKEEMKRRMWIGWMDELVVYLGAILMLWVVQIAAIFVFGE